MSKRTKKIPWPEDQYFVDEETKTIWVMGSFMRAMMLKGRRDTYIPGYEIKLCQYKYLQELRSQ